jgi:Ca2+-binding EF-hand superfamily protein
VGSSSAFDRNRDGRIERWEWDGTWQAFNQRDANGDGVLSGDELLAVGTSGVQDGRFSRLDINGDGRIDRSEWDGTVAEFNRLDSNRNNLLESREVIGVSANAAAPSFNSLDRNRDGRITIEEWNWNRRSFDRQDTDGDGAITRAEFTGVPAPRQR